MTTRKRTPIDWHWPRQTLAQHVMRTFEDIGAHAQVFYASRGKGKSQFIERDLLPLAREHGYVTVLVNFWASNTEPTQAVIGALETAIDTNGLRSKLRKPSAELSVGLTTGVLNVQARQASAAAPAEAHAPLLKMHALAQSILLASKDAPVLMVFDEAQTLANKPEHDAFVRSLRTLLDHYRGRVVSVFTGSSQTRLADLFQRLRSPFYAFANVSALPPLDRPYLQHYLSNIDQVMGDSHISIEQMERAFAATDHNPRIFHGAVLRMFETNDTDIVRVANAHAQATVEQSGLDGRLADLAPLECAVLELVVEHTRALRADASSSPQFYSRASRERVGARIGMVPTPAQVQNALKRLSGDAIQLIVNIDRGDYRIEDELYLESISDWLLGDAPQPGLEQTPPRPRGG